MAKDLGSTRPRLDKLGVKPGQCVEVRGDLPADFLAELAQAGVQQATRDLDLAFVLVLEPSDFEQFLELRQTIRPAGAVWAVWRKGRKALNEDHVRAAALAAGFVDVKVMRFDELLSGLKLVIRKAER